MACILQVVAVQLNAFFLSYALIPIFYMLAREFTARYTLYEKPTWQVLRELFTVSFIVRIVEALGLIACCRFFYDSPFTSPTDDSKYHDAMIWISKYWHEYGYKPIVASKIEYLGGEYSGYPYFGAIMMQLFGDNVYAARIGNAFLSSLTVLFAYGIMRSYLDKTRAYFGAVMIAFAPIFVVYSACNLKDTALLLAVASSLWAMTNLTMWKYWWPSVFCLTTAFSFMIFCRPAVIFILLTSGCVFYFYRAMKMKGSPALIFTLILVFFLLMFLWRHFDKVGLSRDFSEIVERMHSGSDRSVQNDTQVNLGKTIAKIVGAPFFTLFSPFLPLGVYVNTGQDVNQNWGGSYYVSHAMLMVMSLLPVAFLGIAEAWRRRHVYQTPLLLIVFFVIYKYVQAQNLISTLSPRQTLPAFFILYLLIPLGIPRLGENKMTVPIINACSIAAIVVYNLYRVYL